MYMYLFLFQLTIVTVLRSLLVFCLDYGFKMLKNKKDVPLYSSAVHTICSLIQGQKTMVHCKPRRLNVLLRLKM